MTLARGIWLRLIFLTIGMLAVGVAGSTAQVNDDYVARLEKTGFFDLLSANEAKEVRLAIRKRGVSGVFSTHSLMVPADFADIAKDGGAAPFLKSLSLALSTRGFRYKTLSEYSDGDTHRVEIDGTVFKIWDAKTDGDMNAGIDIAVKFWGVSGARVFGLVNSYLDRAKSPVRLYAVGGGNDGWGFVMTPSAARELQSWAELGRERPYLITEQPPSFGGPG